MNPDVITTGPGVIMATATASTNWRSVSQWCPCTPIEQHHNRIGLPNRIIAMGGEQDNLLFRKRTQQLENLAFTHRIEARGGLIENNERSIMKQQPRQCQS